MEDVMMHCNQFAQKGFSYIFTLLMVALLGLSLTLAIDIYSTTAQRDKEKELLSIGRQFRSAIGRYYESNQISAGIEAKKEYPNNIQDLLQDTRSLSIKRYLRKVFIDPLTGKAEWGEVRVGGRLVGVHSLSNQMPIKQAFSEAEDIQFNGKAKYSEWVFTYPADLTSTPPKDASKITFPETSAETIKQDTSKAQDEN